MAWWTLGGFVIGTLIGVGIAYLLNPGELFRDPWRKKDPPYAGSVHRWKSYRRH